LRIHVNVEMLQKTRQVSPSVRTVFKLHFAVIDLSRESSNRIVQARYWRSLTENQSRGANEKNHSKDEANIHDINDSTSRGMQAQPESQLFCILTSCLAR